MVTVPVLSVSPALMVRPTLALRLKSFASAGATGAAATASVASSLAGCFEPRRDRGNAGVLADQRRGDDQGNHGRPFVIE